MLRAARIPNTRPSSRELLARRLPPWTPLPAASPLWALDNALITPHTAGETRRYEDNVIDLLLENLERIWRGETQLRNHIV